MKLYEISAGEILNPWSDDFKDVYKQRIDLYDGKSDKRLRELDGGKAPQMGIIPAAGFSFDGNLIAMTGFEKKERSVLIFETDKGRKVNSFQINDDEQSGAVTTLCLSADARLLAAGYGTKIDIFEVALWQNNAYLVAPGRAVSLTSVLMVVFPRSPGENNDKYIWDAATGENSPRS